MTTRAIDRIIETYIRPSTVTKRPAAVNLFKRLADSDPTAVADCLSKYGNMVWAFAYKYTNSFAEANVLAREIFEDIWKYAEHRGASCSSPESQVIRYISVSRYYKFRSAEQKKVSPTSPTTQPTPFV